jgi:hypothetical protein
MILARNRDRSRREKRGHEGSGEREEEGAKGSGKKRNTEKGR